MSTFTDEMTGAQMNELNFDRVFAADGTKTLKKFAVKNVGESKQQARRMFTGCPIVVDDIAGGTFDSQSAYADEVGMSNGHISGMLFVGRIVSYVVTGKVADDVKGDATVAKIIAGAKHMSKVWDERFPSGDPDRVSFAAACLALSAPEATATDIVSRAGAAALFHLTFGDVQKAAAVARGPKPEKDEEESGSEGEISWQVKLSEALDRARRQGATDAEVAAEFMRLTAG